MPKFVCVGDIRDLRVVQVQIRKSTAELDRRVVNYA